MLQQAPKGPRGPKPPHIWIGSRAGRGADTHTGLDRRPRLPFLPMTGVPKCSGLVRGSLSRVWRRDTRVGANVTVVHSHAGGGGRSGAGRPATHFALCKVARSFQAEGGTPQGLLVAVVEHCGRERRTGSNQTLLHARTHARARARGQQACEWRDAETNWVPLKKCPAAGESQLQWAGIRGRRPPAGSPASSTTKKASFVPSAPSNEPHISTHYHQTCGIKAWQQHPLIVTPSKSLKSQICCSALLHLSCLLSFMNEIRGNGRRKP